MVGKVLYDDYTLLNTGYKKEHKHGVGLHLNKFVDKSVMGYHDISDKILLVMLLGKPFDLSIMQVYAPTTTSTDDEIEKLYSDLDDAYKGMWLSIHSYCNGRHERENMC